MTAIEPRGEPWPYAWPPNEHCEWHRAHEPVPPGGAYIVCGECGHLYETAEDLENIYYSEAPTGASVIIPASGISFCPYCLHDF